MARMLKLRSKPNERNKKTRNETKHRTRTGHAIAYPFYYFCILRGGGAIIRCRMRERFQPRLGYFGSRAQYHFCGEQNLQCGAEDNEWTNPLTVGTHPRTLIRRIAAQLRTAAGAAASPSRCGLNTRKESRQVRFSRLRVVRGRTALRMSVTSKSRSQHTRSGRR